MILDKTNQNLIKAMSFQWTLVAAFLYLEIAIVFVFLIPIISPTR